MENHKQVQVDGMDAKRPVCLNHADLFQPRLYHKPSGGVIYITKRERDYFKSKYDNEWFQYLVYFKGARNTVVDWLVRRMGYQKITSADVCAIATMGI